MKQSVDQRIRDFAKIFKTDFIKKTSYFKTEDFTLVEPIEVLALELNEIDDVKEAQALRKNLLVKNNQVIKLVGSKRTGDSLEQRDDYYDQRESYKRFKYGEDFEDVNEILELHQ